MAKKTVGYVELEWTCPNCSSKNLGMKKSCETCGAPQPANIQFELGQQRDLIADAAKAQAAAKGADIHCPYCGTRNPADAQTCLQCGGDLKEGAKHASGQVLVAGPIQAGAITCPSCGTVNPAGSGKCSACGAALVQPQAAILAQQTATQATASQAPGFFRPWMALPIIAILLLVCVAAGFFLFRTEALTGVVQQVGWQRVIYIEEMRDVNHEAWKDQIPTEAKNLACEQKYRTRQDNPAPNAKEVCATTYVDKGNGAAEVVETCYYEVYDDYCSYTLKEWKRVDQATAQGADLQPYWPTLHLDSGQREGGRKESYTVNFETKAGVKEYSINDPAFFAQFQPDSEWTLSVNSFGQVVDVSP